MSALLTLKELFVNSTTLEKDIKITHLEKSYLLNVCYNLLKDKDYNIQDVIGFI